MKIIKGKYYAVITGDIIGSTKLSIIERKALHNIMQKGSVELRKVFGKTVPLDVDIFRGDGWQIVIYDPKISLRVGLFYRAFIKAYMASIKVDTRMAIGVGTIDFIPGDKVSEGDGEAYRNSGKILEDISKSCYMRFVFSESLNSEIIDTIVQLVDVIAMRWSSKQALAVLGALQGWHQEKIASLWLNPIKQQTVQEHLESADWRAVKIAVDLFEKNLPIELNNVSVSR